MVSGTGSRWRRDGTATPSTSPAPRRGAAAARSPSRCPNHISLSPPASTAPPATPVAPLGGMPSRSDKPMVTLRMQTPESQAASPVVTSIGAVPQDARTGQAEEVRGSALMVRAITFISARSPKASLEALSPRRRSDTPKGQFLPQRDTRSINDYAFRWIIALLHQLRVPNT